MELFSRLYQQMTLRLDQFVSKSTGMSRKDAQRCIRKKHLMVDGEVVTKAARHIESDATVLLDHEQIYLPGDIYIMLHKPAGVVSATEDPAHPTVLELIDHPHWHTLHVVGRLDKDTTGLLLLTNDGDWSHKITSPRHHVPKTYLATLAESLSEESAQQLREGVLLKGEKEVTQPAEVMILPDLQVRMTIHQGMYHQVKRMFAAVGNRVESLHRERVGEWSLSEDLVEGEWQLL